MSTASIGSPSTVGARLRTAREKQGIPLRQIAERTRISVMVLEALERDDIKRLPGGIFTRAFLRSYALEVGLDPDTTVDDFLAQFSPESVSAGMIGSPIEDHQAIESGRRAAQTFVRLLALSLPLAGVVIYFTMRPSPVHQKAAAPPSPPVTAPAQAAGRGSKTPPPVRPTVTPTDVASGTLLKPSPAATSASTAEAVVPVTGVAATAAKPLPTESTKSSTTDTSAKLSAANGTSKPSAADDPSLTAAIKVPPPVQKRADNTKLASSPDSVVMVIDQASPCWVAVAVDGEAIARARLSSGERLELKATREIVVTVGEDTPCAYTLNGAAGRPLGQPGAIVTRRISPDNYRTYLSR